MDFKLTRFLTILIAGTGTILFVSGCSSSMGYVDYASIPGPTNDVSPQNNSGETDSQSADIDDTGTSSPAEVGNTDVATEGGVTDNNEDANENLNSQEQSTSPEVVAQTETLAGDGGNSASLTDVNADPESLEPREIKLLIPDKKFREEGDAAALRLSYDDIDLLKVLNMQPVPTDAPNHFPDWLANLDGKRIRIRGFMYPTFEATGIDYFRLARDNGICCFVKQPKIYDIIDVVMADGETTDYIENKPFDVEGTFRIDPDADDTELFQLYRIEDAVVLK